MAGCNISCELRRIITIKIEKYKKWRQIYQTLLAAAENDPENILRMHMKINHVDRRLAAQSRRVVALMTTADNGCYLCVEGGGYFRC